MIMVGNSWTILMEHNKKASTASGKVAKKHQTECWRPSYLVFGDLYVESQLTSSEKVCSWSFEYTYCQMRSMSFQSFTMPCSIG